MKVTDKLTFDQYWNSSRFAVKRPVRNGSVVMAVGDNIYHRNSCGAWIQADSHHSLPDGTPDVSNLQRDTSADAVLLSDCFYYFGREAPTIPPKVLSDLGYKNIRDYRKFSLARVTPLLDEVRRLGRRNYVLADPFDFERARSRFSAGTDRITDDPVR